jgi:hypothetical protein
MPTPIQRNKRGAAAERRNKCYLVTLPNELRRDILMMALPTAETLHPERNDIRPSVPVSTPLALAQTCLQRYTECLEIYYSQNTFKFAKVDARKKPPQYSSSENDTDISF